MRESITQIRYELSKWLRGKDLNLRPPGYEPDELPTALPRDISLCAPLYIIPSEKATPYSSFFERIVRQDPPLAGTTLPKAQHILFGKEVNGTMETYTVKAGDTLFNIAKAYGVPLEELARVNRISDPNRIFVNEVLQIPDQKRPLWYVVRYGDTLTNIAKRYFTTVEDLLKVNALSDPDAIYPGERIRIR